MALWRAGALALAFQAILAGTAFAQSQPPTEEELVVTGRRVEEAIRNFVTELSVPPAREDQLARWDREVCVGVIGIRARYGQFLVDRISQRAVSIGLRAGEPGCRANVVVFVTPDSDRLAQELVDDFETLMAANWTDNTITQGREALQAFAATPRAVRWWHISSTVTADGQVLGDAPSSRSGDQFRTQVVRTTSLGFGRLNRTTRQDFSRVIIIVDARRAAGMQFDALADYVSMVALAQVDADADTSGVDTILNLFADQSEARPTAMTDWDLAYLDGLYNAPRNARDADQQEEAIVRRMQEGVTAPPEE
jgi:hypothetical protein